MPRSFAASDIAEAFTGDAPRRSSTNVLPKRSSVERPSAIHTCGARQPACEVCTYVATSSGGNWLPSGMQIGEFS
jgi:hypothetical protein